MTDPGQTAYEARFTDEERRRRYAHEWARLGPLERAMWARVEAASINAIGRVLDGEDRISAALRTINFEVAAIKAAASERVEAAEAKLRTVLQREAETHARHDAKVDDLERRLREAKEAARRSQEVILGVTDPPDTDGVTVTRGCIGRGMLDALSLDARRYRRLRVLGAVPPMPGAPAATLLRLGRLDRYLDADLETVPSRGEMYADLDDEGGDE